MLAQAYSRPSKDQRDTRKGIPCPSPTPARNPDRLKPGTGGALQGATDDYSPVD